MVVAWLQLCTTELIEEHKPSRTRRDLLDHYSDQHCLEQFSVESSTIIRTKDSRENGAVFINETEVETLTRCLHLCCSTPLCNVAVFGEGSSCYLFDCGSPEAFKCQFTGSDDFASAVLDLDRHRFDLSAADVQKDHSDQLQLLRSPKLDQEVQSIVQDDCGRWQFSCNSGDCIAIYDVCNGIAQCRDGSDEDKEFCKTETTPAQGGREVFTQRPGMQTTPSTLHRQVESGVSGGVANRPVFQHRAGLGGVGGGLHVPPVSLLTDPTAQRPDYMYPPDIYSSGLMRPGIQYPAQSQNPYGLFNQYPSPLHPSYYLPQAPHQPPRPQQQLPVQKAQPGMEPQPATEQQSTRGAVTTSVPTSTSGPSSTTTYQSTTQLSEVEKYEKKLIEELGEEVQPMEMPGIALFTLVIGVLLTTFIIVIVICRIRRGRISFRRKLTHEADGDFLVNGMYL